MNYLYAQTGVEGWIQEIWQPREGGTLFICYSCCSNYKEISQT